MTNYTKEEHAFLTAIESDLSQKNPISRKDISKLLDVAQQFPDITSQAVEQAKGTLFRGEANLFLEGFIEWMTKYDPNLKLKIPLESGDQRYSFGMSDAKRIVQNFYILYITEYQKECQEARHVQDKLKNDRFWLIRERQKLISAAHLGYI